MNLVQLEHVKLLKEYLDLMMRFAGFPMIVHEGESLPQIQGSADAVCLVLSTYCACPSCAIVPVVQFEDPDSFSPPMHLKIFCRKL